VGCVTTSDPEGPAPPRSGKIAPLHEKSHQDNLLISISVIGKLLLGGTATVCARSRYAAENSLCLGASAGELSHDWRKVLSQHCLAREATASAASARAAESAGAAGYAAITFRSSGVPHLTSAWKVKSHRKGPA
jgi:hypothetical protein